MKNININVVTFLSFEKTNTDIEWFFPIAKEFHSRGISVNIFLINNYRNLPITNIVKEGINLGFNVKHKCELFQFANYLSLIFKLNFISVKYLNKVIRLFEKIIFLIFRPKLNKYINILNGSDIIFANNYSGVPTEYLEKYTYLYLKESEVIFVGVPIITWPYFHQLSIYPFDFFFVGSINEFKKIKDGSLHKNTLFFGCPSLDYKYLSRKKIVNKAKQEKQALIITNNDTNPIYLDWNQFYDTQKIVVELRKCNYKVLIKMHPRSSDSFKDKIYKLQNSCVTTTDEQIEESADYCDVAISYLSTGILKVIAKKIPAYLYVPETLVYSKAFSQMDGVKDLYFESYKKNITRIDSYCIKVSTIEELIKNIKTKSIKNYSVFSNQFNPNGSSKRIVDFLIESHRQDS